MVECKTSINTYEGITFNSTVGERETEKAAAMRSSAVVFAMMVVAIGFLAAESSVESEPGIALPSDAIATAEIITEAEEVMLMRKEEKKQHPIGKAKWPCCDDCGVCNRKQPPECKCNDLRPWGCHPGCKKCVQSLILIYPPQFYCDDWITNFCKRKCTVE